MQSTHNTPESQLEKLPSEELDVPQELDPESEESDESPKRSIVDQLLDLAESCEFWHDPSRTALATIPFTDHQEHYKVESTSFDLWLRHQFFKETARGVPTESMKQALSTLSARAMFRGETHEAFLRVAQDHDGHLWLDLCDDQWRAIQVTKEGWKLVTNPPVRFLRHPGMRALPVPESGQIDCLWPLIHCAPEDQIIVVGLLLNALHPTGPYFGLNLFGSKGSAKSTATRILRSLIDPNEAFSQSMPATAEHLALSAQGQQILAFENLSKITEAEADWLCRLSTGDAIRRRTLYSDSDETIFRAKRPWIINGIPNLVSRGDLIDRALSVELLPIDRSERREEGSILSDFKQAAPQILGALLDGISHALRTIDSIRPTFSGQLPRMADVALWITAAEPALGFEQGTFLRRQREIAAESSADAAEGSGVAITILRLADDGWEGLMKDLLEEIKSDHPGDRYLPQSPRGLGSAINRLKTDLWEAHGVRVAKLPRQAAGVSVRIWKDVQNVHDIHEDSPDEPPSDECAPDQPAKVHPNMHPEIRGELDACV